jgi:hypothetical protein
VLDPRLKTFYGARVTDCGDPAYQDFLLEQARRHLRFLPASAGICIDRLDWLRYYNLHADDGLSMRRGRIARALVVSWKGLMARLGPLMRGKGKVIFANPMTMRVDLYKEVDGFYSEHGESGPGLNGLALLAMSKTAITWTCMWWKKPRHELKPDPDSFFQRHLLMGVYPTAPYPFNNHALRPHPETDRHYLDYGPLLDLMRGKRWVLEPHCAEAAEPELKVNLFEVPGGYVMPVVFGLGLEHASVRLRNLPDLKELAARVHHPGEKASRPVSSVLGNSELHITLPLVRGCAMVMLARSSAV